MKTMKRKACDALTFLVCAACFVALFLWQPAAVRAQWTTPDANQNINNTNSGNVGVGTSNPNYKFDIFSVLDRAQIRFGTTSGDSGGYLFSAGASNATFSGGAGYNSGWFAKSLSAGIMETNLGQFTFYTNGALSTGSTFTPAPRMVITVGGNVGVGTTTPGERLVTFGNLLVGNINSHTQLYPTFDSQQNMLMEIGYGTATADITPLAVLALTKNLTGTSQGLGSITFANSNIANGSEKRLSAISTFTDGALNSGALTIGTTASGTLAERVRITSTGRVGIGTATPSYPFDLVASGAWIARFKKTDNSNGGVIIDSVTGFNPNLALAVNGTNKWYLLNNASGSDVLQFWESTGSFPRFTLTQAGTVGIGTPTPSASYKLDVQGGSINSSGGLCIAGDCKTSWSLVGGSQWSNGTGGTINYAGGNVGIGIASPVFSLDISGGLNSFRAKAATVSSGDAIATFENNSGSQMIVRGNGNVGIGTVNPSTKLHVAGTVAADTLGVGTTSPAYTLDVNGGVAGFRAKAATVSSGDTIASFENTGGSQMIVRGNGNVGIGTTNPSNKLHVAGSITVDGNINAKYQDLAEWVDSSQELPAGTVVVLDPDRANQVVASTQSYDSGVAGVISSQPGVVLGEAGAGRLLVATTGRVKVKVDASNGPIKIGDLLVTSDKEGVAMKSVPVEVNGGVRMHRPGTLIGKALQPLAQGTGEILVLLSLQ
jgi:hypothetical protein